MEIACHFFGCGFAGARRMCDLDRVHQALHLFPFYPHRKRKLRSGFTVSSPHMRGWFTWVVILIDDLMLWFASASR
jgi:hypothetical protein